MRALLVLLVLSGCVKRISVSYEEPPAVFVETRAALAVKVEATNIDDATIAAGLRSGGLGLYLNRVSAVPVLERELKGELARQGYSVGASGAVTVQLNPLTWYGWVENRPAGIGRPNQHCVLELEATFTGAGGPVKRRYECDVFLWPFNEPGAMDDAAHVCAVKVLEDLKPKQVTRQLVLDKSDPLGEPGLVACENARFDEALKSFTEASAKAPQSAALVYNRGLLSLRNGQVEQADRLLAQAVKLKPQSEEYAEAKAFSERAMRARSGWAGQKQPAPPP